MQNKNFFTKTRWLVTIILLLTLSVTQMWAVKVLDFDFSDKDASVLSGWPTSSSAEANTKTYTYTKTENWNYTSWNHIALDVVNSQATLTLNGTQLDSFAVTSDQKYGIEGVMIFVGGSGTYAFDNLDFWDGRATYTINASNYNVYREVSGDNSVGLTNQLDL